MRIEPIARALLIVVTALLVFACASQPVPPAAKLSIRNVAVISLIGDQVRLEKSGLTVFENDAKVGRFEWGLDRLAAEALETALKSRNPAITISRLSYDPAALFAIYGTGGARLAMQEYADPTRIEAALRTIVASQAVDTLVLITRASVPRGLDMPGSREGPGMHLIKPLAGPATRVLPFAALQIHVVDARTLRRIGQHTDIGKEMKYWEGPIWSPPPPTPFKDTATLPLTVEQEIFLRAELARIVPATLAAMLPAVGL